MQAEDATILTLVGTVERLALAAAPKPEPLPRLPAEVIDRYLAFAATIPSGGSTYFSVYDANSNLLPSLTFDDMKAVGTFLREIKERAAKGVAWKS